MSEPSQNCVIYLRVSSQKQVREGDGLNSQLYQCQEYAKIKGYNILQVFQDDGISGSKKDRAGLQSMFDFLGTKPNTKIVVYDSKRFARAEPLIYYQLMDVVKQLQCRLEYVTMQVDDSPVGRFMEGLSGLQANLEREQNAEQVKSLMKARLMNGYWQFQPPFVYKWQKGIGKELKPNQPNFNIFQQSILGYINGEFQHVIQSYNSIKNQGVETNFSGFCKLIRNPLICGVIHYPSWGVDWLYKNENGEIITKHEPVLSLEQFDLLQAKLDGRNKNSARLQDIVDHFPFKSILSCLECRKNLTGYYTTKMTKEGKKQYPYYACRTRGCSEHKLGMPREQVNQVILEQISLATPEPRLIKTMEIILRSLSQRKEFKDENTKESLENKVIAIGKDIDNLINRISKSKIDSVAETLESRVLALEIERQVIIEKIEGFDSNTKDNVRTLQEKVLEMANNLPTLFDRADNSTKKNILEVVFEGELLIKRQKIEGMFGKYNLIVRTPKKGLFYALNDCSVVDFSFGGQIDNNFELSTSIFDLWFDEKTLERASRLCDRIMI